MAESSGLWPNPSGNPRCLVVYGNSVANGVSWLEWKRPLNCRGVSFFVTGSGGCGGTGVLGASGSAAGGGGGGSAGQTIVDIPSVFIPERLFISVAIGALSAGFSSYVSAMPDTTANHVIAIANGGGAGGNGSGSTGGTGGTAGAIATAATMPLGWAFAKLALAGQAGTAGGGTVAGTNLTLPTTGLRVTGGTGGGGYNATSSRNGGSFTTPSNASVFPPHNGGAGSPSKNGAPGYLVRNAGMYWYGGTGGAARSESDTNQYEGGDGGFGCGGGGMAGSDSDHTPAEQSRGGSGVCVITWW